MAMYGYIYKTTNTVNNKIYVGQHKASTFNDQYKGSGIYLKRAIKKYGVGNFNVEFLDFANSREELNKKEIYWIDKFNSRNQDIGYNVSPGGESWPIMTDEIKQKLSIAHKGMVISEETRKKISKANTGHKHSEETRRKISQSNLGKVKGRVSTFKGHHHTEETKELLSKLHKGKSRMPHSEETKRKMSDIATLNNPFKGKHHTQETKEKLSKALKGKKLSKEVIDKMKKSKIGKIWINNGSYQTYIYPEEFDKYEKEGFSKGMIKQKGGQQ